MMNNNYNILEEELKKHSIFKDESKLSFDYVPLYLPHRNEKLRQLAQFFKVIIEKPGGMSQKVIIHGSNGTGKTAVIKRFGAMIENTAEKRDIKFKFLHLNCRINKTEYMILKNVIRAFNKAIPKRGFSSEELLRILIEILEIDDYFLILALDDLSIKENQLLYDLTRLMDDELNPVQRLSLIIIAKDLNFIKTLEKGTISTLQKNHIFFEKYSSSQLYDVLKMRCNEAFYDNTVLDESLHLISDIASEFGDARYALELLWRAGKYVDLSQSPQVSPEYVRQAKSHISPVIRSDLIHSLTLDQKLLLLTIARQFKHKEKAYLTMKEVENGYILICEEYQTKAKKHTKIWENIQELSNLGIINSKLSGPGIRGKTTLIGLSDVPSETIEYNLISQLEKEIEV
ncbi:MAG: ORC1-type DNA replication protein [Candidatus Helarchaeota archaeon]|nr:ORC1-type DNA replication protein [Candidatus Helarchaeota archaeon]